MGCWWISPPSNSPHRGENWDFPAGGRTGISPAGENWDFPVGERTGASLPPGGGLELPPQRGGLRGGEIHQPKNKHPKGA
jgi:hypothetical protein